jgi:hypothetical protein
MFPYYTSEIVAAANERHNSYKPGAKQLVNSYVESTNAGTGHGRHVSVFEYSDGSVERASYEMN